MNTLVASALGSFLFRRVEPPRRPAAEVGNRPTAGAAPDPWTAQTRPLIFRSEAFAEDLVEDGA